MSDDDFRMPTTRQRVVVMGRTGAGKTQKGFWLLSHSPFDRQPYVIIDYKGDDLLNAVDRVQEIGLNEVPRHAGLYILHPRPVDDDDAMEAWMRRVWDRERIGLFFDEMYMVPEKGGLQGILTQGRSKNIPAICLTQRPARVSRFVFSEADFYSRFHLNDRRDQKTVQEFLPEGATDFALPEYHSQWYDVGKNKLITFAPVPPAEEILSRIDDRLRPNRRILK